MLTAFAQYGLGKEAVAHFEEMRRSGIHLNDVSFISILTACSHGGLVKEGKHYFDMMRDYNVEPLIDHYVCFIDLLGRADLLNEALIFAFKMPMEPTAAVWKALLGACRMHKNANIGQFAANHVFELDPDDTGPPVLLYNIYASTGQWDDAARVRKMMKQTGVKKEPACSWVEIENSVHMAVISYGRGYALRIYIATQLQDVVAQQKGCQLLRAATAKAMDRLPERRAAKRGREEEAAAAAGDVDFPFEEAARDDDGGVGEASRRPPGVFQLPHPESSQNFAAFQRGESEGTKKSDAQQTDAARMGWDGMGMGLASLNHAHLTPPARTARPRKLAADA
ncbi:hypothetical protein PR202_gb22286 [Eleusine coracana subsp. coracana]|uniref:Pentatricopeptide repeat-containing protein n=1 Tax=Eleusine coracana subsp. coracana TaxID=191504 RepID=A0AAV5FFD1_ELECO|nr:hypothetical protein PR202_gb22286 [Eleusine coracana subsp. coracana]